jgi:exopolysaccharide production protein ExoQ
MSNPSVASHKSGRPRFPAPKKIDKFAIIAFLVFAFVLVVDPILIFSATGGQKLSNIMDPRPEPRIFWPAMAVISVLFAVQHRARFSKLDWSPNIISLLAYLAFAGASVLWAFSPDRSLVRYVQQMMILTAIVLPVMLTSQSVDIMRGLFLIFALALVLNSLYVVGGSVTIAQYGSAAVDIGYQGYFLGKNYLGECAAPALLLAFDEMRHRGWRRAIGVVVAVLAICLVYLSDSKTALGLALVVPFLAWFTLIVRNVTRISPAIILLCFPLCYAVVSSVSHFNMNRVSYMLYGDSTLTGRTVIWDFVQSEIDRRPLVGWGYQSFWLVPGSPALTEAPGWVKLMPNAHNGYNDTTLEMGHIGLALLLVFILATLHAIGRVADRDPARAQLLLSLALFIICYNYFESLWMRGYEFLWVTFLFVAVEIARYWQPLPLGRTANRSRTPKPSGPAHLPSVLVRRPRVRLS